MNRTFLRWAGGKSGLAKRIVDEFPEEFGTYWEPFLGSGAVFLEAQSRGLVKQARLGDVIFDVIAAWRAVRDTPGLLCKELLDHAAVHSRKHYYLTRGSYPNDALGVAARAIYLNRTCYNGLWRENSQGAFNVPMGNRGSARIADTETIMSVHGQLAEVDRASVAGVELESGDFRATCRPKQGDLVYIDPPYDGGFTGYSRSGFDRWDQENLHREVERWISGGALVLVSNADTPFIRKLWAGWKMIELSVPRKIAGGGRTEPAPELLITNIDMWAGR